MPSPVPLCWEENNFQFTLLIRSYRHPAPLSLPEEVSGLTQHDVYVYSHASQAALPCLVPEAPEAALSYPPEALRKAPEMAPSSPPAPALSPRLETSRGTLTGGTETEGTWSGSTGPSPASSLPPPSL
eukprot:1076912-Prorocentrum_minimum.AAC.1